MILEIIKMDFAEFKIIRQKFKYVNKACTLTLNVTLSWPGCMPQDHQGYKGFEIWR